MWITSCEKKIWLLQIMSVYNWRHDNVETQGHVCAMKAYKGIYGSRTIKGDVGNN